jgi:thioredoxin reductase (NADPH)
LAPKYHYFAELYGQDIQFYKIFRQGNKDLSAQLNVRSSPTLIFYKDGQEVAPRLSGTIKKSEILRTLVSAYGVTPPVAVPRATQEYDVAIIGGGPAGMTAALYASRAKLKTLVIDKGSSGGYVNVTHSVANYPGTGKELNGYMLGHLMTEQAKHTGAEFLIAAEIQKVDLSQKRILIDDDKEVVAKTIVVATGSKPRPLNIPGEKEFGGKGISYCATCDGAFYEGKDVLVIGGGNSAVEESIFLTKFAKSVTIIHQFDEFQANKLSAEEALSNPKIKVLWSHEPRAFLGKDHFEMLEVEDLKTKKTSALRADGVFVFVGYVPQTELIKGQLNENKWGYLETNEDMETNIPGVYVAGDVRSKKYRQITTAVSDGTIAALQAERYIRETKK